jgi:phosphoglycolate phosphatase
VARDVTRNVVAGIVYNMRMPERQFLTTRDVVGIDLDMTLVDTVEDIMAAAQDTAEQAGVQINSAETRSRLGEPIQNEFVTWGIPPEDRETALLYFRQRLAERENQGSFLLPGARELLRFIDRIGYISLVLTTKETSLAHRVLEHFGLFPDMVIGSPEALNKPAQLAEAEARAYIGDHRKDMIAAATAGVIPIGVTTGNHSRQQLFDAGARHVVRDLREVPPLLETYAYFSSRRPRK